MLELSNQTEDVQPQKEAVKPLETQDNEPVEPEDVLLVISPETPEPEQMSEPSPEPQPETQPETRPRPQPEARPELKPESQPESNPEPEPEPAAPAPEESGDVYTGDTDASGQPHGSGTMKYKNGDVYTGQWENGEQNGTGTLTHANGDVEEFSMTPVPTDMPPQTFSFQPQSSG